MGASEPVPRIRRIEPLSQDWRSFGFPGGCFDTGRRSFTPSVEGTIRTPEHLVLVTIAGGAERVEVTTECGHRYVGRDRPGLVSLVPAGTERRLAMTGVEAQWASIAWSPSSRASASLPPFTNREDPFLHGLVGEFLRQHEAGELDAGYCEQMAMALGRYVGRRYGGTREERPVGLAPWRLARITDFIEAHLSDTILVADLARVGGLSSGHLHRAFRMATGVTPAAFIRQRRLLRAAAILREEPVTVAEVALRVGIQSPSRLAAQMKRLTGLPPSRLRR